MREGTLTQSRQHTIRVKQMDDLFVGKSQVGAAIAILRKVGSPMKAGEIWRLMHEGGFVVVSAAPATAIKNRLVRRAMTHGDVAKNARGEWFVVDQILE